MKNYPSRVILMKRNKTEKTIEVSACIISVLLLIKFVPKPRIREASVAFLFKQLITWLFGLIVVEKNLIKYPFHIFFKKTSRSSFTFEYFVYPSICVLFNLYYPEKKSYFVKIIYHFSYTSIITMFEMFAVKYTKLIKYTNWTWYYTSITLWLTFYLSRIYQKWFFKIK